MAFFRSSTGPHAAEVAEIRLQQRLQKIGGDFLAVQVEVLLAATSGSGAGAGGERAGAGGSAGSAGEAGSPSTAAAAPAPASASAPACPSSSDLVAQSILFARHAGFLHDEVRLKQFVGLLSGIARHAVARTVTAAPAPAPVPSPALTTAAAGRDASEAVDEDTAAHGGAARAVPRLKNVVGGGGTAARMTVDTKRVGAPVVPAPDSPRSRRPEGASPTSLSPLRIRPSEAPQSLLDFFLEFVRDMPAREAALRGEHLVAAVMRRLLPHQPLIDALKARYKYLRHHDSAFAERVRWIMEAGHGGTPPWVAGVGRLREMFWGHWVIADTHRPVATVLFDFVSCFRGFVRADMLPEWSAYEAALTDESVNGTRWSPRGRSASPRAGASSTSSASSSPRSSLSPPPRSRSPRGRTNSGGGGGGDSSSYSRVVAGAETLLQQARDSLVLKWTRWAREGLEQDLRGNLLFMFSLRMGHLPGVGMEFSRLWDAVTARWCLDAPQAPAASPRSLKQRQLQQPRPLSPSYPRSSLSPRAALSPRARSPLRTSPTS